MIPVRRAPPYTYLRMAWVDGLMAGPARARRVERCGRADATQGAVHDRNADAEAERAMSQPPTGDR